MNLGTYEIAKRIIINTNESTVTLNGVNWCISLSQLENKQISNKISAISQWREVTRI